MKQGFKFISTVALLLAVFFGFYNAVARYVDKVWKTQLSSNAFLDLQWQLFSLLFLVGLLWVHLAGKHIEVDVFEKNETEGHKNDSFLRLIVRVLLEIPFAIMISYSSWNYFLYSLDTFEGSSQPGGLPVFYVKSLPALCFSVLAIYMCAEYGKQLYYKLFKNQTL